MNNTNFNIGDLSRDKLEKLFSAAKKEIAPYSRCIENIDQLNKKIASLSIFSIFKSVFVLTVPMGVIICLLFAMEKIAGGIVTSIIAVLIIIAVIRSIKSNKEKAKAELSILQQEKEEIVRAFEAILWIPDDYCSEYAIITMHKFLQNYEANDWKEVVKLYREHVHNIEQKSMMAKQIEIAKENREILSDIEFNTWLDSWR